MSNWKQSLDNYITGKNDPNAPFNRIEEDIIEAGFEDLPEEEIETKEISSKATWIAVVMTIIMVVLAYLILEVK